MKNAGRSLVLASGVPVLLLIISGSIGLRAQPAAAPAPMLTATAYPPVPTVSRDIWLSPTSRPTPAMLALGKASAFVSEAKFKEAAPLVAKPTLESTPLEAYQKFYAGIVAFRLGQLDAARRQASELVDEAPAGYLSEGSRRLAGEIAEAQGDFDGAASYYEPLTKSSLAVDDALMRLGRAKKASGDAQGAAEAFARVYFEFPLSDLSATAAAELDELRALGPIESGSQRYKLELGRAERLFGSRRYAQARDAFAALSGAASGDDKELVALRVAESDFYLKRYQTARDALMPWTDTARRRAEAQFFALSATRELGERAEYERQAHALVNAFPTDSWSEETLNSLATSFIIADEDDEADAVFREYLQRFPDGRYTARARWKIGWTAYRTGKWADCADTFERAAAALPKSDYRPTWIYWAARSREQLGDTSAADRLYGIVVADYMNSYYGRLASKRLEARKVQPMTAAAAVATGTESLALPAFSRTTSEIPTAELIRALIGAGMFDDAVNELQWAQKTGGDSSVIQATLGYVYAQRGDLRKGINAIKRAVPQYLSAAGDDLPTDVLQVLFPVAYWDVIRKNASSNGLDPYLVAALVAQESTFDATIKSHANAIGLMQIVPATGRHYARRLRIPRYSVSKLSDPNVNARIGSVYFADLVSRFGGVPYALASYNAGPGPVARWMAERPGIATDEFIDDIPYPETQNYVRKILGTAEDYRRLYGDRGIRPLAGAPGSSPQASYVPVSTTSSSSTSMHHAAKKSSSKKSASKKHARR
jgi:soluble lytic murein transglycosylase